MDTPATTEEPSPFPAIDALMQQDLRSLRARMEELRSAAGDEGGRDDALEALRSELSVHASVMDAKATALESGELVSELLRCHRRLGEAIDAFRRSHTSPDDAASSLEALLELGRLHELEEEKLLARWRARFSDAELAELGVEAKTYRESLDEPAVG